jgi:MFS transporter, OFA family, oxalate/formate antiporter
MRNTADKLEVPTGNRSVVAIAAFCMQLALGSVYGWSVFLNPLREVYSASKAEIGFTFTVTLAVLGITAVFGGAIQRSLGPRITATAAGLLYGAGVLFSGFAPTLGMLYLTFGVVGGIGLGLGYIVPLAILIRWFPDRRGFITGLAVAGFGLGAFVTSPLASELIRDVGVQRTLMVLGAGYLLTVVLAAQFLRAAPENYAPPGWVPTQTANLIVGSDCTLTEALRSPYWYLLWLMLALNVSAGAALLSVAAPLAQEFSGVDTKAAAFLVSVIAVFNGVGRLFWGSLSDRIGRSATFFFIFVVQVITFAYMASVSEFSALLVTVALIALCYGGGFGTMPAFAADVFGAKHAGTIYGAMLTAWSAGAIVGPMLITSLPYRTALLVIVGMLTMAVALPLMTGASRRPGPSRVTA